MRMYRSETWPIAGPEILMARQQGLDQSHMVVDGARWFETSTVMPPECDRARVAFLRTMEK